MPRHRLSDDEWDLIKGLFPAPAATGRPPRCRRPIVDAILWVLRTGAPWRDLPEEYGPWGTAWDLFDKWNGDGTLDKILSLLRSAHVDAGEFDKDAYRRRSIVENLIGWLKECRRVFSRFEKTAKNFGGMIKMAFIERYLRLTC